MKITGMVVVLMRLSCSDPNYIVIMYIAIQYSKVRF
jgi:hypothetical protein